MRYLPKHLLANEHGATAVYAGLVVTFLFMITVLAVDVGHLYGVRNELQNAADAGSLAGAAMLLDEDGNLMVQTAIDEATRISAANRTGSEQVAEIVVETGHWSFTNREFTANPSTTQIEWEERTFSELDLDTGFINAVRVLTSRTDTPSFFANFLGVDQVFVNSDAVAYIGFAGTLYPTELVQPIAICKESITDPSGAYTCNMGRMLNSGGNAATHNSGGWTNFSQPCDTASSSDMRDLICENGNEHQVEFGQGIGTTGGVQDSTLDDLYDCWEAATGKTVNWNLTLPVIECPANNVSNCSKLIGAVNINLIWIVHKNDPHYNDVPREMTVNGGTPWTCDNSDGFFCWKSFVDFYKLQNVTGPPVTDQDYEDMYQKKNMFFLPDCLVHEPKGKSGGENFGIFAKIPRLVE
ncbi:TadG family pilus assembly protein [Desulfogranum mediterraneum]|uniref:TadG family pilus assembly protein n=1 Tax=Desulfogranum mediterraneum TaxID=160661 RepID=UPI00041BDA12|nr:TadG family pilus assembly protein [Desulfogranum mediterraneum]